MAPTKDIESSPQARVREILAAVRPLASEYYRLTGKPLGVTGEVAEYVAAETLGLTLAPPRTRGYDALRGKERIQIKGRACGKNTNPAQRISRIKTDAPCDTVLFVLLDDATLEPREMWEAPFASVATCLARPGSKARERGALAVREFKRIARLVWPKQQDTEPPVSVPAGRQNKNGQILVETTDLSSPNHRFAKVWILRCPKHGTYKANSCDFHIRRCPEEGGQPGL
jgi:hypothetical protein